MAGWPSEDGVTHGWRRRYAAVTRALPTDFALVSDALPHHGVSTHGNAWPERLGGELIDEIAGRYA